MGAFIDMMQQLRMVDLWSGTFLQRPCARRGMSRETTYQNGAFQKQGSQVMKMMQSSEAQHQKRWRTQRGRETQRKCGVKNILVQGKGDGTYAKRGFPLKTRRGGA